MRRGQFSLIVATTLGVVLLLLPTAGLGADRSGDRHAAQVASVVQGDDEALAPLSPLGGDTGGVVSVESGDDDDPGETIIYAEPDLGEFEISSGLWMMVQLWGTWL